MDQDPPRAFPGRGVGAVAALMLPDPERIPTVSLTETQSFLLSAASRREDLLVPLPDNLKGIAADKVARGLITKGFAEERVVLRHAPAWRRDDAGEPIGLRITRAGLAAIGLGETDEAASTEDVNAEPTEPPLAPVSDTRLPDAAKPPRAGSKQGQLIAMLSRGEGASIGEIATALGWLPHTTRAALTGLRHRGYELARETNGERGSLYHIIGMPIKAPAVIDAVRTEAA